MCIQLNYCVSRKSIVPGVVWIWRMAQWTYIWYCSVRWLTVGPRALCKPTRVSECSLYCIHCAVMTPPPVAISTDKMNSPVPRSSRFSSYDQMLNCLKGSGVNNGHNCPCVCVWGNEGTTTLLTLWRRNFLLNFSTPCI